MVQKPKAIAVVFVQEIGFSLNCRLPVILVWRGMAVLLTSYLRGANEANRQAIAPAQVVLS